MRRVATSTGRWRRGISGSIEIRDTSASVFCASYEHVRVAVELEAGARPRAKSSPGSSWTRRASLKGRGTPDCQCAVADPQRHDLLHGFPRWPSATRTGHAARHTTDKTRGSLRRRDGKKERNGHVVLASGTHSMTVGHVLRRWRAGAASGNLKAAGASGLMLRVRAHLSVVT